MLASDRVFSGFLKSCSIPLFGRDPAQTPRAAPRVAISILERLSHRPLSAVLIAAPRGFWCAAANVAAQARRGVRGRLADERRDRGTSARAERRFRPCRLERDHHFSGYN